MLKRAARSERVHSDIFFFECNKSEKAGGGGAVRARDRRGKPEDTFWRRCEEKYKDEISQTKSMSLTPKKRVNVALCLNFKLLWVVLSLSVAAEARKCLVPAPGFCFCTLRAAKVVKLKCFDTCVYVAPFKIVPLTVTALRHILKSV